MSARKQQKDDFTRVFVAVASDSPKVLGYYALNVHAVVTDDLGVDRPRRVPNTGTLPALYLSMIAVDRSWQGKGLGSDLAVDALSCARNVSGEVGLKLVVLDVIDDGGDEAFARRMEFYCRLGFRSLKEQQPDIIELLDTCREGISGNAFRIRALHLRRVQVPEPRISAAPKPRVIESTDLGYAPVFQLLALLEWRNDWLLQPTLRPRRILPA